MNTGRYQVRMLVEHPNRPDWVPGTVRTMHEIGLRLSGKAPHPGSEAQP